MMKFLNKYGFLFLALLIMGSYPLEAQENLRLKKLQELKHLEEKIVDVDEIEPFIFRVEPRVPMLVGLGYGGNSSMRLAKRMDDLSISKRFTFNVEEDYSDIFFRVIGKLSEGRVRVKIFKPDRELLKELQIVPGKEKSWEESFCLVEIDDPGFKGKWSVELSCSQASGFYQFQFRSR